MEHFPGEIIFEILHLLIGPDLLNFGLSCRHFWAIYHHYRATYDRATISGYLCGWPQEPSTKCIKIINKFAPYYTFYLYNGSTLEWYDYATKLPVNIDLWKEFISNAQSLRIAEQLPGLDKKVVFLFDDSLTQIYSRKYTNMIDETSTSRDICSKIKNNMIKFKKHDFKYVYEKNKYKKFIHDMQNSPDVPGEFISILSERLNEIDAVFEPGQIAKKQKLRAKKH